jgi:hypothetical protein
MSLAITLQLSRQCIHIAVFQLQLKLFVVPVDEVGLQTLEKLIVYRQ